MIALLSEDWPCYHQQAQETLRFLTNNEIRLCLEDHGSMLLMSNIVNRDIEE